MKVAMLWDAGNADGSKGGAELTMEDFRDAAPPAVELVEPAEADTIILGNIVTFKARDLVPYFEDARVIRYRHDLSQHGDPDLLAWLDLYLEEEIYTSPLHRDAAGIEWSEDERGPRVIPPAINLDRFRPNRQTRRHGKRDGIVAVASWQNPAKGGRLVADTCGRAGLEVDVYGTGAFPPYGTNVNFKGPVTQAQLPSILWRYEQFIHLPLEVEPFGRCVVEAHYAGCEVLTNELTGAAWWLKNDPEALETAGQDFWEVVLDG